MAEGQRHSVLKRKAEAGRTSVAASRQITPAKALSNAVVQTAETRLGLVAAVPSATGRVSTLAELLDTVPEGGLIVILEGPGEAQGLVVFDAVLLSSLIEKMMTGRLAARPPQSRRPTRTDAALTADLIDDVLRRFEVPLLGTQVARWAAGFGYSSYLDDPRPLGLLMEDVDYRTLSLSIDLEAGSRSCALLLALPADGRGGIGNPAHEAAEASLGARGTVGGDRVPASPSASVQEEPHEEEAPWHIALEQGVLSGRVSLTAQLHRFDLPISSLEALRPGVEIPVPFVALDECNLIGPDGSLVATGRLGQSRTMRAVRLPGAPEATTQGMAPDPPSTPPGLSPDAMNAAPGVAPEMQEMPNAISAPGPGTDAIELDASPALPPDLPDLPSLPDLPDLPDLPQLE